MEMTVVNGRDHPGLGLGLSLGIAGTTSSVATPHRALTGAAPTPGQKIRTSSACHEMPLFLRGIDVNRAPAAGHEDQEPGASSPDSTLSTLSGKRGRRAAGAGGREQERACSDDEDSGFGSGPGGSRKKLRLSKDQSAVLEDSFNQHSTLNLKQKAALARQLGLRPRQVEVWFQNRRARTKLKQTEVDCEALRRRCDALTEENRRLLREVQALKLPMPHPQLYMRAPPLTMCPSCERVASSAKPAVVAESRAVLGSGPWGPGPVRPVFVDRPRPAQRA